MKGIIGLVALLPLSFAININTAWAENMPYLDQDFSCIDQSKANQYRDDYNVDIESFGGMELCKPTSDTKKLFNDLSIIENGQFAGNTPNNLIKNFIPLNTYYTWMKSQTRGMQRGNDIPYATAYNSFGNFTMQDGWADLTTLGRVGTVIHEARHTAGYRHFPCNQGPYAGASLDGCDRDYQTGGSHTIEMEYYARVVVLGTNFHPVYQSMARLMAMARANFVFNQQVIRPKEQLVLQSDDNKIYLLDDQNNWNERKTAAPVGEMKRTSYGVVFFDGQKTSAVDLYKDIVDSRPLDDLYSYFKLLKRNAKPTKLFEEFDSGNRRYVVRIGQDSKLESYNFPGGTWGAAIPVASDVAKVSTTLPSGQSGLFLITTAGQVYNYDFTNNRIATSKESWDNSIKSVTKINNRLLALKTNGQVLEQSKTGWQPWTQNKAVTALVSAPVYDAFEVQK